MALLFCNDYRHPFVLAPAGTRLDCPLSIDGDVVFSCLKGAEDGDGLVLRFVLVFRLRLDDRFGQFRCDGDVLEQQ